MHDVLWVRRTAAALVVAGCLLAGCNEGARGLALDKQVARDALVTFLQAWQKGGKPADLKAGSPAIIVGDPDWDAGKRLTRYYLTERDSDDGTNLHSTVELVVQDARGTLWQSEITYVIGTSPVITIFRR
jgi:hypothetical protein